jgi:hypothetical protein
MFVAIDETSSGNLISSLVNMQNFGKDRSQSEEILPSQKTQNVVDSQIERERSWGKSVRKKKKKSRRIDYNFNKHKLIDFVEYQLHPTFPRPDRRMVRPPFSLNGGSW